jgi:peptidoglycan/LPS O-acetylase OafA/YrhL
VEALRSWRRADRFLRKVSSGMSDLAAKALGSGSGGGADRTVTGERSVTVVPATEATPAVHSAERLQPLDGWRGLSILLVLACHMAPLGPKSWALNGAAGLLGMSLFFTLSGFLITSMLLRKLEIRAFFIRRGCRILPLVLAYIVVVLAWVGASPLTWLAHGLFIENYWDSHLLGITGHLWSICVEVHFYLFIGLLCLLLRRRAFWCLPLCAAAVTVWRVHEHCYDSIETHLRVDEILSGACLALVYQRFTGGAVRRALAWWWIQPVLAVLLVLSCHEAGGWLNYLRPYFAAALVGSTLLRSNRLQRLLETRTLAYIAAISYALYVIHPLTLEGWMSSGSKVVKYMKRPLCLVISFGLAHLSTFYYEKFWIARGKAWSADRRREVETQPV